MSKFGDDIRRISKYQELLALILGLQKSPIAAVVKGAVEGARGVAFGTAAGGTTSSMAGTPGTTKPTKAESDPKKDDPKDAGKDAAVEGAKISAGGAGLGGDNNEKQGWYDMDSLLQGAKDAAGKVPPGPGDVINTVSGMQEDLRAIFAHLGSADSAFVGPSNLPDGSSSSDPNPDPNWSANYYYTATNFAGTESDSTFSRAGYSLSQSMIGFPLPAIPGFRVSRTQFVSQSQNPVTGSGDYIINYWISNGVTETGPTLNPIGVSRGNCTSEGNPSPYCLVVAPQAKWDDLDATQLAWVSPITERSSTMWAGLAGRFAAHPSDVNVPADLKAGVSILDLKTTAGNDVRLGPTADGGFYAYYRNAGTGLPTGSATDNSVLLINPNRTPAGFITPNALVKKLPI